MPASNTRETSFGIGSCRSSRKSWASRIVQPFYAPPKSSVVRRSGCPPSCPSVPPSSPARIFVGCLPLCARVSSCAGFANAACQRLATPRRAVCSPSLTPSMAPQKSTSVGITMHAAGADSSFSNRRKFEPPDRLSDWLPRRPGKLSAGPPPTGHHGVFPRGLLSPRRHTGLSHQGGGGAARDGIPLRIHHLHYLRGFFTGGSSRGLFSKISPSTCQCSQFFHRSAPLGGSWNAGRLFLPLPERLVRHRKCLANRCRKSPGRSVALQPICCHSHQQLLPRLSLLRPQL